VRGRAFGASPHSLTPGFTYADNPIPMDPSSPILRAVVRNEKDVGGKPDAERHPARPSLPMGTLRLLKSPECLLEALDIFDHYRYKKYKGTKRTFA